MDRLDQDAGVPGAAAGRAYRFVLRFAAIYGAFAVVIALALALVLVPASGFASLQAKSAEAVSGGLGAGALAPLLMALIPLAATLLLAAARAHAAAPAGPVRSWLSALRAISVGTAAREGQAAVVVIGAIATIV